MQAVITNHATNVSASIAHNAVIKKEATKKIALFMAIITCLVLAVNI